MTKTLSRREIDVLQALSEGQTLKAAARQLGIAEETAKSYAQNIRLKWDVRTNTQAVAIAARQGVI